MTGPRPFDDVVADLRELVGDGNLIYLEAIVVSTEKEVIVKTVKVQESP